MNWKVLGRKSSWPAGGLVRQFLGRCDENHKFAQSRQPPPDKDPSPCNNITRYRHGNLSDVRSWCVSERCNVRGTCAGHGKAEVIACVGELYGRLHCSSKQLMKYVSGCGGSQAHTSAGISLAVRWTCWSSISHI